MIITGDPAHGNQPVLQRGGEVPGRTVTLVISVHSNVKSIERYDKRG